MILTERAVEPDTPVGHLYVHIPFCPRKCDYCAFVTHVGSLKLIDPYMRALKLDAKTLAAGRPNGPLHTVYFGGGTPSLVPPAQIFELLNYLHRLFGLTTGCEITLEAHPLTVDLPKLREFRRAGVTRLSFGGESLDSTELTQLGRDHDGERVLQVVELARAAGVENVNVDFMYGIPRQTLASWEKTLRGALTAELNHLSLYPLAVEPRTVFARKLQGGVLRIPGDDLTADMYALACRMLRDAGYEHYEIANWARPGQHSEHNLAYWYNREFFALGVGAHAYLRPHRTENVTQTRRYIECVLAGDSPVRERVHVDPATHFSETIMLRLRLLGVGVELAEMKEMFGVDIAQRFADELELLNGLHLLESRPGRIVLAEHAVPVANEVWQRFML